MPVGPSHGSRGGGSFGGSRGGSFGSSRGGSFNPPPRSPRPPRNSFHDGIIGGMIGASIVNRRRERFASRYGVNPSDDEFNSLPTRTKPTIFLILSIIFAFFAFCSLITKISLSSSIKTYNASIEIMKSDWDEYEELFEKANDGEEHYYTTTATFQKVKYSVYGDNPTYTGAFLDFEEDNISWYFIVYEYIDERTNEHCTGTTYTQFSANQIQSLNGKILIAYYSEAGKTSFSMNTSYNLEDCKEYQYRLNQVKQLKSEANSSLVLFLIELAVVGLFITLYIIKLKKYYKLVQEDEKVLYEKKKAEAEKAQAESSIAKSQAEKHHSYCKYCGSKLDATSNICPACGARITKE